jgi:hypothetical protein
VQLRERLPPRPPDAEDLRELEGIVSADRHRDRSVAFPFGIGCDGEDPLRLWPEYLRLIREFSEKTKAPTGIYLQK